MSSQKVEMGDVVYYIGSDMEKCPAIVAAVKADQRLDLFVFFRFGLHPRASAPFSAAHDGGTWHYKPTAGIVVVPTIATNPRGRKK